MKMKKSLLSILLVALMMFSSVASADVAVGDRVITLGADLNASQKTQILNGFGQKSEDLMVTITHQDEVKYLTGLVPPSVIGTRAISSVLITFGDQGDGLTVETNNINWVSQDMYRNSLLTAGIKDAHVVVTAPFAVSGTAALVGITKAFETATGESLPEQNKKVANEEMVKTATLADQIGDKEKAAQFISALKEEIQKKNPVSDADYTTIIQTVAEQMGITLNDEQMTSLMDLLKKIKELNIDWQGVANQISDIAQKANAWFENNPEKVEAGKNFLASIWNALIQLLSTFFS
ncbi:DUF1002 domain-containing protein [Ammoniphilus sp. YIM 78166]|uniref:DUF1002 domain-containing protein n=1 Tax=Ammoniphilus sp. YIM 78166 TaxID=1644106 RepID=UPI001070546E|nr:DUF1002 domain-containing protein [Ammoniphilus sp. YIM 78166]